MVSKLQEEKRRLLKEHSPNHTPSNLTPTTENDILQRLKNSVEKQRDEIRFKEKLLQEKNGDVDNVRKSCFNLILLVFYILTHFQLKTQVERLTNSSKELRRKHKSMQYQVRTLCDERADFLVQLQDQQRDISALRQRLGLAQKENEDLVNVNILLIIFLYLP